MSQEHQLNISLDKTTGMACDKCGNEVFIEGRMLRKASRFLTGTAQDAVIPISVFACSKCGHVNDEFLPVQLRNNQIQDVEEVK
jgi:DNA-directed RNA polymerase subunit RPC12/RpoP